MSYFTETMGNLLHQTAFFNLTWGNFVMILVACIFLYLAIAKGFEPLLLVPIAFGMLLVNIYPDIFAAPEQMSNGVGGLFHYFYTLDEWSILPSYFPWRWCDDRFWTSDRKPDQLPFRSSSTVWYFRRIFPCNPDGIQ